MEKKSVRFIVLLFSFVLFITGSGFSTGGQDFIKWVDLNPKAELMERAYSMDVKSRGKHSFASLLAYCAVKNGNSFNNKNDFKTIASLSEKLKNGGTVEQLMSGNKYYSYYLEAYTAIFKNFIGWYQRDNGQPEYGLTAYYPLAEGYWNSGSDDFGNSRSFGFKRRHLGHDMFGSPGTPVVAVEGGTVAELGWNRYGGWRVGILSEDGMRYWYYAHLRKDKPYAQGLAKGARVAAGEVIGYLGRTGYSNKENSNMSGRPHLHFGLQLIFDKSQIDGNGEIWVDVYQLTRFLAKNKAKTIKTENGHRVSTGLKTPLGKYIEQ